MEGTQTPTKIPASLSGAPRNPNHKLTESAKDKNAALNINMSEALNIIPCLLYEDVKMLYTSLYT